MNQVINNFCMHGSTGIVVLHEKWIDWVDAHQNLPGFSHENGYGLGKVTHHSWEVDGEKITIKNDDWIYSKLLPDANGFIAFENTKRYDNCLLLDAYGKERMRLCVPWQMTGATNPAAQEASEFDNISEPYTHPNTLQKGTFGVTGWVGEAKFYFELDYVAGQFLWCRQIRD
jgi:hypothetical protein